MQDWDPANQPKVETALASALKYTKNGTLYLLHSTSPTNVTMLGTLIDEVRARGYEFALFPAD